MKEARLKVPVKQGKTPEISEKSKTKKARFNLPVKIALIVLWVFVAVIASQLIVGYPLLWLLGRDTFSTPVWTAIYSATSYLLALLLVLFVTPRIQFSLKTDKKSVKLDTKDFPKVSRETLGLSGWPTWTDIGLSPIGFIVSSLFAAALTAIFQIFPWFNPSEAQNTGFSAYLAGSDRIIAFIVLVILAPIFEEIIFRGWLYGKLRRLLSAVPAIIITSLLFGLVHFQWNVGINVFALSVVLCVLREITGTIYAGTLTHMIKNGVAFYLLYVVGLF